MAKCRAARETLLPGWPGAAGGAMLLSHIHDLQAALRALGPFTEDEMPELVEKYGLSEGKDIDGFPAPVRTQAWRQQHAFSAIYFLHVCTRSEG